MPPKSNPHAIAPVLPEPAFPKGIVAMAGRCLRVAILDDNSSVRTAISRLLNASGMIGGSYATCIELFNAVAQFRPDCIILDLYMPGLDGMEVMNYLRRVGVNTPVVMITAQDDPALRDICLEAGATAFMRKPLHATELLDTIVQSSGRAIP